MGRRNVISWGINRDSSGYLLIFYSKKFRNLILLDVIACVSPIGIFFGRIANFINGELVGKVSSVPWGVIFPQIDLCQDTLLNYTKQSWKAYFVCNSKYNFFKKKYEIGSCSYLFFFDLLRSFRIISELLENQIFSLVIFITLLVWGQY